MTTNAQKILAFLAQSDSRNIETGERIDALYKVFVRAYVEQRAKLVALQTLDRINDYELPRLSSLVKGCGS